MTSIHPDDRALTRPAADLVPPLTSVAAMRLLVLRNYLVYRDAWKLFVTGFFEPLFYLLSIGIGVGSLIDSFEFNGQVIDYASFVAPGMLAASAFNGALIDMTYNVFFKLKFDKLYDQMLATPLSTGDIARGEIAWGQLRGGTYCAVFILVMGAMGMLHSWWAVLALPAALLIGFAFAAVCMGLTTYMKSWQDFDKITLAQLPLFLFSATFFPVTAYPDAVRWLVEVDAALPRRGAVPRADHRRGVDGLGVVGALPRGDGAGRAGARPAPARPAAAQVAKPRPGVGQRLSQPRDRDRADAVQRGQLGLGDAAERLERDQPSCAQRRGSRARRWSGGAACLRVAVVACGGARAACRRRPRRAARAGSRSPATRSARAP